MEMQEDLGSMENEEKRRVKTPERMSYEAEVDVIKKQVGDLEEIRYRLGLSARKMAQLLLVDPSAWSRWTKKITQPPPHIYRALQWFLILQEKNPGFTPQVFLASHWHSTHKLNQKENEDLQKEIHQLKQDFEILKKTSQQPTSSQPQTLIPPFQGRDKGLFFDEKEGGKSTKNQGFSSIFGSFNGPIKQENSGRGAFWKDRSLPSKLVFFILGLLVGVFIRI